MVTVLCVGACVLDHIVRVDDIPRTPIKFRARSWDEIGGGLAANASVAIARLGGHAVFCGRVGDDAAGGFLRDDLVREGVDIAQFRLLPGIRTTRSIVLVDRNGERLLATYSDPGLPPDADWLKPQPADSILVDLTWPRAAIPMLDHARNLGIPSLVDADAATRTGPQEIHEILKRATHLVFSRTGLAQHSGEAGIDDGLRAMSDRYGVYVGVTDGANGYYWLDRETVRHLAAPRIDAVDTNGAGDVFHGAFALGLARRDDPDDVAEFALLVATLKCTQPGGRAGTPTDAELGAFRRSLAR